MATSYSNPLRLAIQATGDNANTWGDILNNNTLELIEQAIAETTTIDLTVGTGNYTLTTANGSPDEARRAALKFTGASAVDRTIIIPSLSKIYVVANKMSVAKSVTISTGSGATVTLAQNELAVVYCDGTEVFATGAAGVLLKANNLSDLASAATSRTNLGVYSKAEVDALIGAIIGTNVGAMQLWGTGTAPTKWLICDGSEISRTTYSALFGVIGTTYGAGNGSTTFTLPNFKGRSPIGAGQGNTAQGGGVGTNRVLGALGGAEGHTLVTGELASHFHAAGSIVTSTGGTTTQSVRFGLTNDGATVSGTQRLYMPGLTGGISQTTGRTGDTLVAAPGTVDAGGATTGNSATAGSGDSHNNMHPFQVVNIIIYTGV